MVTRALRRSWAQLIKRVYEVDPLVCLSCGGEMGIIAFITDHDVVDATLRHLANSLKEIDGIDAMLAATGERTSRGNYCENHRM